MSTKTGTEILPQLIHPIRRRLGRFSFIQKAAAVGIGGAIIAALTAVYVPSLAGLFGALAGFFAALVATALFKAYEADVEILNHRRKIIGPLEHRARALGEPTVTDYSQFERRFEDFKQLQDSEEFGFLSDNVRGIYLDCVDLAETCGAALRGEAKVTVIPNDFGITANNVDVKQLARAPLLRCLSLLLDHCRIEARVPRPHRTLRIGTIRTKRIGRLIIYRKTEETSAP